jgi:hypothetical protein
MPGYVIHTDKCRVISPPFQPLFLRYPCTELYITYILFWLRGIKLIKNRLLIIRVIPIKFSLSKTKSRVLLHWVLKFLYYFFLVWGGGGMYFGRTVPAIRRKVLFAFSSTVSWRWLQHISPNRRSCSTKQHEVTFKCQQCSVSNYEYIPQLDLYKNRQQYWRLLSSHIQSTAMVEASTSCQTSVWFY